MTTIQQQNDDEHALSTSEQARLAHLEIVIEDGIATFMKVGQALWEIRTDRLYRETHGTFQDYCGERWHLSKTHANRLIQSVEVVQLVTPTGVTPPASERQARELVPLRDDPEALRETWAKVVSEHPEPTAAQVQEAVVGRAEDAERRERGERSLQVERERRGRRDRAARFDSDLLILKESARKFRKAEAAKTAEALIAAHHPRGARKSVAQLDHDLEEIVSFANRLRVEVVGRIPAQARYPGDDDVLAGVPIAAGRSTT